MPNLSNLFVFSAASRSTFIHSCVLGILKWLISTEKASRLAFSKIFQDLSETSCCHMISSWWFQPIGNIQLDHCPKYIRVKQKKHYLKSPPRYSWFTMDFTKALKSKDEDGWRFVSTPLFGWTPRNIILSVHSRIPCPTESNYLGNLVLILNLI